VGTDRTNVLKLLYNNSKLIIILLFSETCRSRLIMIIKIYITPAINSWVYLNTRYASSSSIQISSITVCLHRNVYEILL